MEKIAQVAKRFAQVAVEEGPVGLEQSSRAQIVQGRDVVASSRRLSTEADLAKAAAEPGVAESGIETDGLIDRVQGGAGPVVGGEQAAIEGVSLSIARTQFEGAVQRAPRLARAAGAELQFRHAFPSKGEPGRLDSGAAGGGQSVLQPVVGLMK